MDILQIVTQLQEHQDRHLKLIEKQLNMLAMLNTEIQNLKAVVNKHETLINNSVSKDNFVEVDWSKVEQRVEDQISQQEQPEDFSIQ